MSLVTFKDFIPNSEVPHVDLNHSILIETAHMHWQAIPKLVESFFHAPEIQAVTPQLTVDDQQSIQQLLSAAAKWHASLQQMLTNLKTLKVIYAKMMTKVQDKQAADLGTLYHNTLGQSDRLLSSLPDFAPELSLNTSLSALKNQISPIEEIKARQQTKITFPLNILIIEDNPDWQEFIKRSALTTAGEYRFQIAYEGVKVEQVFPNIYACANLDQAKEILNKHKKGDWMIISDLSYPQNLDGPALQQHGEDFVNQLREYVENQPVIVMTADNRWQTAQKHMHLGAEFLSKTDLSIVGSLMYRLQYQVINLLLRKQVQKYYHQTYADALIAYTQTEQGITLQIANHPANYSVFIDASTPTFKLLLQAKNNETLTGQQIQTVRQTLIQLAQHQGKYMGKHDVIKTHPDKGVFVAPWPTARINSTTTAKPKILLIEDEAIYHQRIQAVLQSAFEIEIAETQAQALEKSHNFQPDLLLSDLAIPETLGGTPNLKHGQALLMRPEIQGKLVLLSNESEFLAQYQDIHNKFQPMGLQSVPKAFPDWMPRLLHAVYRLLDPSDHLLADPSTRLPLMQISLDPSKKRTQAKVPVLIRFYENHEATDQRSFRAYQVALLLLLLKFPRQWLDVVGQDINAQVKDVLSPYPEIFASELAWLHSENAEYESYFEYAVEQLQQNRESHQGNGLKLEDIYHTLGINGIKSSYNKLFKSNWNQNFSFPPLSVSSVYGDNDHAEKETLIKKELIRLNAIVY